eukprot:scaffold248422_cov56-Cyclotella_meneghiniana.AAC.12
MSAQGPSRAPQDTLIFFKCYGTDCRQFQPSSPGRGGTFVLISEYKFDLTDAFSSAIIKFAAGSGCQRGLPLRHADYLCSVCPFPVVSAVCLMLFLPP